MIVGIIENVGKVFFADFPLPLLWEKSIKSCLIHLHSHYSLLSTSIHPKVLQVVGQITLWGFDSRALRRWLCRFRCVSARCICICHPKVSILLQLKLTHLAAAHVSVGDIFQRYVYLVRETSIWQWRLVISTNSSYSMKMPITQQ